MSFDSLIIILGAGWFASKYQDTTTILISGLLIPPTVAFILLNRFDYRILNLFLWYTISFTHGILPLISSLVASNIRSVTQKMTITAMMLIAFCSGNMYVLIHISSRNSSLDICLRDLVSVLKYLGWQRSHAIAPLLTWSSFRMVLHACRALV